ncbi:Positive regulator of CheA protein activity (CheW) [Halanaerobium saccharolyticum subsp. saccharolyticum DSM 6643]|uniref:Positive regulator of CheA protein activity (CheW) n=1 Tax=Halanaerobium saccharolyticum subsp. saccharolyticum DSM 6643 TaxID=1293054 RepID=M5E4C6_9FIRM|nr:chemotaxis protein CheW [Halanaerobium saccharolyticum]CCU80802.1 Positive regulator of CheA protein activity (CheW) [Halanaerobium saccharolyticum subsp. saccharolyticum DSM 6643]
MNNKTSKEKQEKYIIFTLAGKQFGVHIKQTREILSSKELTLVPESPDYIAGLIDLRGMVVPVVDLQLRLNITQEANSQPENSGVIIIVELDDLTAGMMVEEVKEIKELHQEEIAELPKLAQKIDRKYIAGVGRTEGAELLMLLDLKQVLSAEEMNQLQHLDKNIVS